MSAQLNSPGEEAGSPPAGNEQISGSPAELEREIQARRDHLAATIDELAGRARPQEIARRTTAGVQDKIREFTHTPDGDLRSERLAALGGAAVVILAVMVAVRRRR